MTKKIDTGGPAHLGRYTRVMKDKLGTILGSAPEDSPGATWLDVCAWKAMQGLMVLFSSWTKPAYDSDTQEYCSNAKHIARASYQVAAAMLAEKRRLEDDMGDVR